MQIDFLIIGFDFFSVEIALRLEYVNEIAERNMFGLRIRMHLIGEINVQRSSIYKGFGDLIITN